MLAVGFGLFRTTSFHNTPFQILHKAHSTASLHFFHGPVPSPFSVPTPPHFLLPSRTVILLTSLKLVDNSANAKRARGRRLDKPYCIKLPKNNKLGKFGDIIKIAHLGKVHNALIISNRQMSKRLPRYDHHHIILLNEKKEPVGTRILGPVPSALRKEGQNSKIIAMATRFIWPMMFFEK